MARHSLKIRWCSHRKFFKECLAIFRHLCMKGLLTQKSFEKNLLCTKQNSNLNLSIANPTKWSVTLMQLICRVTADKLECLTIFWGWRLKD